MTPNQLNKEREKLLREDNEFSTIKKSTNLDELEDIILTKE